MIGWSDFFIASAGAAAALSGTLLVAMSINIARIVSQPTLPGRAANTLIIVGSSLMVSAIALVPMNLEGFGVAVAAFGVALLISAAHVGRIVVRRSDAGLPLVKVALGLLGPAVAPLPYSVGGLLLAAGHSGGLFLIASGVLIGLAVSLINSWVLLVEVLR